MSDQDSTEEFDTHESVVEFLSAIQKRHIDYIQVEGYHLYLDFTDPTSRDHFRLELSLDGGNFWLHRETDKGFTNVYADRGY